jgi:hypothetical protein
LPGEIARLHCERQLYRYRRWDFHANALTSRHADALAGMDRAPEDFA